MRWLAARWPTGWPGRRCFPELVSGAGWTCLAAAEGRGGPGCELVKRGDSVLLNGEKSWIAGAGVLESLVVSVGEGEARCFVGIQASAPGVTIDLPRAPGFLGEMSQGVARFDDVAIPAAGVINEPARGLWFRGAEPLYVMLALNACLRSLALNSGREDLVILTGDAIDHGRTLPVVLDQKAAILPGLAELRALTVNALTAAVDVIAESATLAASWQADARLFAMFGLAAEDSAA
ncbi:MAG: hypothetical protein EP301_01155 [Gammaproteobacteria bacterium]|nr:MAG: hypothetical protein EP301_01155 [Gammaproteobacteria bacterium]